MNATPADHAPGAVHATSSSASRQTIGDLLRRSRLRHPQKIAVRCGSTSWTYT